MATLMERPEVESRPAESTPGQAPDLRVVGLLWAAATALYMVGIVFPQILMDIRVNRSTTDVVLEFGAAGLLLLAGGVAAYFALRRSLPARAPRPVAWIGGSLLAGVAALVAMSVTISGAMLLAFVILTVNGPTAAHGTVLYLVTVLAVVSAAGLGGALVGAGVGAVQWHMLRAALVECRWVRSSALGWMLASAVAFGLLDLVSRTTWIVSFGPELLGWKIFVAKLLVWAGVPAWFMARALVRGLAGAR